MARRPSIAWLTLQTIFFVCLLVSRAQAGEVEASSLPESSSQGVFGALFGDSGLQFVKELGSVETFVENNPATLAPNGDFVSTGAPSASSAASSGSTRGGQANGASVTATAKPTPQSSISGEGSAADPSSSDAGTSGKGATTSSPKTAPKADSNTRVGEVGGDEENGSVSNSADSGSPGNALASNKSSGNPLANISGLGSTGNLPSLLSSFQNAAESMGGIQRQADTRNQNNRARDDSNSSIDAIDPNGSSVRFGNTKDGLIGDLLARRDGKGDGEPTGEGKKDDKGQGQDDKKKDDGKNDSKIDTKKMGSDVKGMLKEDPFVPSKSKYLELGKLLQQPGLLDNMVGSGQKDAFRKIAQKMFDKYQLADTETDSSSRKNAYQDYLNKKEDDDVFGPTRPNEDAQFHTDEATGTTVPAGPATPAGADSFQRPLLLPSDHQ